MFRLFKGIEIMKKIKAYKVFNPDWTCRNFQYEVGKTYKHSGKIEMCKSGFHACEKAVDCFDYYKFDNKNKCAEVELSGEILDNGEDKICASKIKILREILWSEMLELCNVGTGNTGLKNSGDRNSGNRNSGDSNSGDRNSGDSNSGNWNSGYRNSGYSNSGNWNSGNLNSGNLNTIESPLRIFNKLTKVKRKDIIYPDYFYFDLNVWVKQTNMTDEEKEDYYWYKTTEGYLKKIGYKEAWKQSFEKTTKEDVAKTLKLPNFNYKIFEEISGITKKMIQGKLKEGD